MTVERIVVLAVTKMLSGMCTGGISLSTGKWIRPTKEFGTVLLGDLKYRDKTVMRPFDVVDFSLVKPKPAPPHKEDWVCDYVRARPVLVNSLEDRLPLLEKHSEPTAPQEILHAQRSLALFEPIQVTATFTLDNYSGKYEARLKTPEMGDRPIPVTDIKWRALGRRLLGGAEHLTLTPDDLRTRLGTSRIFVALGLGRLYEGRHWPLVIGVHTWPDYEAVVDYAEL